MDVRAIAAVAAGAAIGGVARLLVTEAVVARAGAEFGYYATFLINVSGSFVIGVVIELSQTRAGIDPLVRLFLATGILGGFTTFSAFSYEALKLASTGFALSALLYALASVAAGVVAAFLGVALVRAVGA